MDIDEVYVALADLFVAEWRDHAACRKADDQLFVDEELYPEAKKFCLDCKSRVSCLDNAMVFNDGFFRGGMTEKERNSLEMHRKRHLAAFRYDLSIV
jgi:hypothetical protein